MTENLADQRDRYVLAQQITASVMPKVMPCQVTKPCSLEQRSQYPFLEVVLIASLTSISAEDEASLVPSSVLHLSFVVFSAKACESFHQVVVNGYRSTCTCFSFGLTYGHISLVRIDLLPCDAQRFTDTHASLQRERKSTLNQ